VKHEDLQKRYYRETFDHIYSTIEKERETIEGRGSKTCVLLLYSLIELLSLKFGLEGRASSNDPLSSSVAELLQAAEHCSKVHSGHEEARLI
jgi:hypothetical protein